jgi:hypothetical protein
MRLASLALCALLLGSCGGLTRQSDFSPPMEGGVTTRLKAREREMLVARDDFSVELVRFTDARRPRSLARSPAEQTMDVYDPDTLLGGVSTRLPAMYEKYLAYKPKTPKHYKVEIELTKLHTEVRNGDFWSGRFGRYAVVLELEAQARRPDSSVVLRKVYRFTEAQRRQTFNGRSPTLGMDESRLVDLVDAAVRKTAMDFAWDIRQNDARKWRPEQTATPTPTRRIKLVPQPSLNRATGSQTGYDSELIVPSVTLPEPTHYAPDSVAPTLPTLPKVKMPEAPAPDEVQPITWGEDRS